jgi:cytochrome c peroxidase
MFKTILRSNPWIIVAVIGAAGLAGLSVPLINVAVDKPVAVTPQELIGKTAAFTLASPLLQTSCLPCHSARTTLPWYAQLPVAKQIISANMAQGLNEFNMEERLYTAGQAPSAHTLEEIEEVLAEGEMPPLEYTAAHWKALITPDKKRIILEWIRSEREATTGSAANANGVAAEFANEPVEPIPTIQTGLNPEKIALGKRLYNDTQLSGDGTVSCATCHALHKGGTDQRPTSIGIHGQVGPINSPTAYNSRYNTRQFWDGRAADLKEQALGPVTNPKEMGGNWKVILPLLAKDPTYTSNFSSVYPKQKLSKELVADAIAAFEDTLITPNSAFDKYLRGDKTALTPQQIKGFAVFKSAGCVSCHAGPALGGDSFKKLGIQHDYIADRGHPTDADLGRYNTTHKPSDKGVFKVPTLRNIEVTYPYFHDGQVKTLAEAVTKMAYYQSGTQLSKDDTAAIVAFLTSLTGEYQGIPLTDTARLNQLK